MSHETNSGPESRPEQTPGAEHPTATTLTPASVADAPRALAGLPALVGRDEAARMFGVTARTWSAWVVEGRVPDGRWQPIPSGKPGRRKVYAVEDLLRLREEFERRGRPYADPDRPGCYRVPLFGRGVRREALVDADSLPLVEGRHVHWQARSGGGERDGYVVLADGKGTQLRRLVLGLADAALCVGHANGDPLDCRRANLVVRTSGQRVRGARKRKTSGDGQAPTSRFKGVSWSESHKRWVVQIRGDDTPRYVGRYWSEVAAARAYDRAARKAFGEDARLNFPDGAPPPEPGPAAAPPGGPPVDCVLDEVDPDAGVPFAPGTCSRGEAARLFDVALKTWTTWESEGRVRCGRWALMPSGGRRKFYVVEELLALREGFRRLGEPRPDPDRPGCYRVPLTSHIHHMEAIVDAEDLPLVRGRHWNWGPDPERVGGGEVILASATEPNTPLKRVITGAVGYHQRVSHRNGDPLDCRRTNLVVRTISEQLWGSRKMGTGNGRVYTSKYKGVSWDGPRGRWLAQIRKDGRGRHLGRFRDEIAAAQAYDEAARELFGEHARLNFPDGVDARTDGPPASNSTVPPNLAA